MPMVIIRQVIKVRSLLPRIELSAIFMFWVVFKIDYNKTIDKTINCQFCSMNKWYLEMNDVF